MSVSFLGLQRVKAIVLFCLFAVLVIAYLSGCAHSGCGCHHKGERTVEVQGHRGARSVFPENTLPAFGYALATGVDVLEMDLGVTKDNVLVIVHDQEINPVICKYKDGRPAPKNLAIRSLTLKEIKQFDCGSMVNPRFPKQKLVPGTEIPTFDELMEALKKSTAANASTVRFNIETKSNPEFPKLQPTPEKFARLVYDALVKHNILERSVIQSFDHRTLLEIKKIDPKVRTSALIEERPQGDLVQIVQAAKAEIASPNFEWLTKEDVENFHKAGLQVIPWTLNDEKSWCRALEMGVDGIITDDPERLGARLQIRGTAQHF